MSYKALDMVGMFSLIFVGISVLGLAALTVGPWADPSPTGRTILTLSWMAFWMINTLARSARALLAEQADQIATLQRQLSELRPAA